MADWYVNSAAASGGDGSALTPWDDLDDASTALISTGPNTGDTLHCTGVFDDNFAPSQGHDGMLIKGMSIVATSATTEGNLVRFTGTTDCTFDDLSIVGEEGETAACFIGAEDADPARQTTGGRVNNSYAKFGNKGFRLADTCSNIVLTNCIAEAAKSGGFAVAEGCTDITFQNCSASLCFNDADNGEAGDGFEVTSTGDLTFVSCASYNNSDDGFDSFGGSGTRTLLRCITYGNGVDRWEVGGSFAGNGNGYKMGSSGTDVVWNMTACVAHNNTDDGITHNGGNGVHTHSNCTTAHNGSRGIAANAANQVYTNCISLNNVAADTLGATPVATTNSWDLSITDAKFLSTTDLRLHGDSPCIGVGTKWWTDGNVPIGEDGLRHYDIPEIGAYALRSGGKKYMRKAALPPARMLPAGYDIAKVRAA